MKKFVIIGAGVGGLAAGIRLAVRGQSVTILEKNPRVGGKLNLWEVGHPARPDERPFRFDTGPSLLTLPAIFVSLFADAGEALSDHLELLRLDPIARFRFSDGSQFSLRADEKARLAEVARFSPDDVEGWKRLAERGRKVWDLSADAFLQHAPEQLLHGSKFGPIDGLKMLALPFRVGMFSTFARWVDREIKSPRLRDVLYQYATYAGSSPQKAPATLTCIPYAEMHFGAWYPRGGMYKLAEALEKIARKVGVQIRTHASVSRILIEADSDGRASRKWRVKGVKLLAGEEIAADAVIANSDVVYTYRELIDARFRPKFTDRKLAKLRPGGSGFVMLLGIEGKLPELAHHNKFMPADYSAEIQATFQTGTLPDDPAIYLCASSRTDDTQAPDGCENLFVLCSAPPLDGRINWNAEGPKYRAKILRALEKNWGLAGLSKRIVVDRLFTPAHLESQYNANAGSIYGIDSNSRKSAFLRPPNRDRHIAGLFFAGGATHPGGGLPLVALSGKIASELATEP